MRRALSSVPKETSPCCSCPSYRASTSMRPSAASRAPVSCGTNFGRLLTSDIASYTASGDAATCSVCSCCMSVPLSLRNAGRTLSLGETLLRGSQARDPLHGHADREGRDPRGGAEELGIAEPENDHPRGGRVKIEPGARAAASARCGVKGRNRPIG